MRQDGHVVHHPVGARRRWYAAAPVVIAASFFLFAGLAEAVPRQTIVSATQGSMLHALQAPLFQSPPPPTASGAEPPYPLNHTLEEARSARIRGGDSISGTN